MALRSITYRGVPFEISYDLIRPQSGSTQLFLHGWGSHKELMKQAFEKRCENHTQLYVDLPGFGKSATEEVLTTDDYAAIVQLFLEELEITPDMVIGHSFGGKVATILNPGKLVLMGSSGIPVPKSASTKFKITLAKTLKPILGDSLKNLLMTDDAKGMPDNMYQTLKNVVDEDFSDRFANFRGKAILLWGENDTATPPSCGERIAELIQDSHLFMFPGDHYFFLQQAREVCTILLKEGW